MTTRKGFVYDTTSHDNPENISPESSDYEFVVDVGGLEDGEFEETVLNLESNTTYFYRAFGYDEETYIYGDEESFTTLKDPNRAELKPTTRVNNRYREPAIRVRFGFN
jgi:hypothetical protein